MSDEMTQEQIDAAIDAHDRYTDWTEALEKRIHDVYTVLREVRKEAGLNANTWTQWMHLEPYLPDWMTIFNGSWFDVTVRGIHKDGVDILQYSDDPFATIVIPWELLRDDSSTLERRFRATLRNATAKAEAATRARQRAEQERETERLIELVKRDPEVVRAALEAIDE